jgi:hypothetical protein
MANACFTLAECEVVYSRAREDFLQFGIVENVPESIAWSGDCGRYSGRSITCRSICPKVADCTANVNVETHKDRLIATTDINISDLPGRRALKIGLVEKESVVDVFRKNHEGT